MPSFRCFHNHAGSCRPESESEREFFLTLAALSENFLEIWKRLEWITNKTCLFYNKWLTIRWGAGVEFLVPFKSWCHNHNGHALQLEITAYMGPIAISDEEKLSPLMFWKRNEQVYPHLSILARVFLTPSASSVPVESLFSITGITKNSRRSSLASYRLNKLTFVHDNYHLFFPIGK